tara:strand:+ start:171 stop:1301 length:1131 start_codon:yes stop_codon:yes gene_type:complete
MKKILAGIIVLAVALTGLPVTSFAGVQVGDNLKLFGDFRMRFEFDERNGGGNDTRERPRIRLRYGAKYQTAVENLSFGFRLATGTNLNSPHSNLATASRTNHGDAFDLDRAFAKLKFLESGVIVVGKQGYPLWQQTEQFWDEDIQPEGYAVAYTASLGGAGSLTAAVAYYYLVNNGWQQDLFDNDTATAWQVAHKGNFGDIKSTLAATGLHTSDGDDSGDWAGAGGGGTSNDPAFYMISGQIKGAFNGFKWRLGGDYHFSDADVVGQSDDHDEGYVIQGRVNMDKWGFRYYYYDVEEFAVPSYAGAILSQDNFPNSSNSAPVGFEGHRIQLDYKVAKGVSTDFRVYLQEGKSDNYGYGETANAERDRYQLNINMKF